MSASAYGCMGPGTGDQGPGATIHPPFSGCSDFKPLLDQTTEGKSLHMMSYAMAHRSPVPGPWSQFKEYA